MDKLLEVAKKFFNSDVLETSKLGDFENWDSLGHINFFMAIEEEFKVKFEPDEIMQNTTIKDIFELLKSKNV